MPIPTFTGLPPDPSFIELVDKFNKLTKEMQNMFLTLDSLNVVSLTADNIDAGTINAGLVKIMSQMIEGAYIIIDGLGMRINDGTKDTFKADVNGHVTMTGALIQSASGYPKIVMDPENELFGVYKSATEYVNMEAFNVGSTSPQLGFVGGSSGMYMTQTGLNSIIQTINSKLNIFAEGDVDFILNDPFDSVRIDFVQLMDKSSNKTLYQQLLGKSKVEETGYNLTFDNTTRNLKMFAKNGDLLAQVNIP